MMMAASADAANHRQDAIATIAVITTIQDDIMSSFKFDFNTL